MAVVQVDVVSYSSHHEPIHAGYHLTKKVVYMLDTASSLDTTLDTTGRGCLATRQRRPIHAGYLLSRPRWIPPVLVYAYGLEIRGWDLGVGVGGYGSGV